MEVLTVMIVKKGMNRMRRNQTRKPLLVKEVILPDKDKPEVGIPSSHLGNEMEESVGSTLTEFVKVGNHEVRNVTLLNLEKKPLENYFGGIEVKRKNKKKNKHRRVTQSWREFDCEESQTESNGGEASIVNDHFAVADVKIEKKKLQFKIDNFKRIQSDKKQRDHQMQRLAEEKYIECQENLAETWWELMKRRKQLKQLNSDDILTLQKPYFESVRSYNRFEISILSRKYWKDDLDKSSEKHLSQNPPEVPDEEHKKKFSGPSVNYLMLDDLGKTFYQKLVFVDDEDSSD